MFINVVSETNSKWPKNWSWLKNWFSLLPSKWIEYKQTGFLLLPSFLQWSSIIDDWFTLERDDWNHATQSCDPLAITCGHYEAVSSFLSYAFFVFLSMCCWYIFKITDIFTFNFNRYMYICIVSDMLLYVKNRAFRLAQYSKNKYILIPFLSLIFICLPFETLTQMCC